MIKVYGNPVRPFHVAAYTEFQAAIKSLNELRTDTRKRTVHQKYIEACEYNVPMQLFESSRTIRHAAEPAENYERIGQGIVNSKERLERMITKLKDCKEIALDMDGSLEKGYRGSHPALIQISTDNNRDFIIDPLIFFGGIEGLRDVMQNKDLPKIMFGAKNDILWWQRYFKIDPFPVIDVQLIHQKVTGIQQPRSLERFLREYLPEARTNKKFQMFDWAKRELPVETVEYAVNDTRYLMQAWHNFKMELQYLGYRHRADIHLAVNGQNLELPPPFKKLAQPTTDLVRLTNESMKQAYQTVWEWRDRVARKYDIYVTDLLSSDDIVSIARNLKDYRVNVGRMKKNEAWKLIETMDKDELLKSLEEIKIAMETSPPKTVANKIADLEQIKMEWSTDDELEIHVYDEQLAELAMPEMAKCRISDHAEKSSSKPSRKSENRERMEIEVRIDKPKVRSVVVVPPAPLYSQSSRHNSRDDRSSRGYYNERECFGDRRESRDDNRRGRDDRNYDQGRNDDLRRERSPKSKPRNEPIRVIRPTIFEQPIPIPEVVTMRREVVETDEWVEFNDPVPTTEMNREFVGIQQQEESMQADMFQQQEEIMQVDVFQQQDEMMQVDMFQRQPILAVAAD